MNPGLNLLRDLVAAAIALAWLQRALSLLIHLPGVPDVRESTYDAQPEGSLTVIVPARDEAANIEATLRSLLAQESCADGESLAVARKNENEIAQLQIIAVNDRSTDETGAIMERVAAESSGRLHVIHITELPAGWVGKPHAMATAAAQCQSEWLLFTDGDVLFAPDALRRAVVCAEKTNCDHLALTPTMIRRSWGEGIVLGFFQAASLWVARPWKVPDPKAKHDHTGLGAFNMVRREAYESIGGFTALRMEVLEDVRLGILLKRAGFRQRLVFGRDMVRVHWASGVSGLLGVMMKNMFSLFRFNPALLLAGCGAMLLFCVAPFGWLFLPGALRYAGYITVAAIVLVYRAYGRQSGISAWYAALFPVGALLMIYALLRSMLVTWRQGGVRWRGTLYTLEELRRNAGPFL